MIHLDLFSGIGGFALAAQTVWGSDYHCVGFCEIDPFCQQVLRKNFEGVNVYGDIRTLSAERLIADANCDRQQAGGDEIDTALSGQQALHDGQGCGERLAADTEGGQDNERERRIMDGEAQSGSCGDSSTGTCHIDLLTGGFPCQPFSTAGKRKGTEDDRFLWPEMFRVIRETKPRWIIGENVDGIIEMALGQVCSDLESLDYEVQPIVIPACAVNAPHRRDRVWIVAHSTGEGLPQPGYAGIGELREETVSSDSEGPGCEGREGNLCPGRCTPKYAFPDWSRDWREVAFESCVRGVDDGLPRRMVRLPDGSEISESKWRQEALKCYGNSIVPEVAMEIMRAIKVVDEAEAESALECAA